MLIALDIDEVLADTVNEVVEHYNRNFGSNFRRDDFRTCNFWETWGGTREETVGILYDFMNERGDDILPKKGAVNGVRKLSEKHKLISITSRQNDFEEQTRRWLERNFDGLIKEVYFTNAYAKRGEAFKKSVFVREKGVELIVEDHFDYACDCVAVGAKVFLLDCPWNQELPPVGVTRVYSWYDIVDRLM